MEMIATARFCHNEKWLRPGDRFITDEANAADLKAIGLAERPKQNVITAAVAAAADAVVSTVESAVDEAQASRTRRRTYARRDVEAE